MNYYLSSYELGNETESLKQLVSNGTIGYIPNARDVTGADPARRATRTQNDMQALRELGLTVNLLDLRDYFGKRADLKKKLEALGAIFISGGNVFVLRQAMKLSGLDEILKELRNSTSFLYAGYSAAGCVLAPSLEGMDIVDPLDTPYSEQTKILWDGLVLVDFRFIPHWQSAHHESAAIDKEIAYCQKHAIPYRAIHDGEVIIIDKVNA